MVPMADLYASVVLPELTIGTEAALPTESIAFRICQYRLLENSGIADDTPRQQLAGIIHLACRCRKG